MAQTLAHLEEFWLPERIKDFSRRAALRSLKDGAVLFWAEEASEQVFFVEEGHVRICHYTDDGDCINLLIHGPGELVGVGGILNGTKRAVTGVAIGRCRVWEIPAEAFFAMMREEPDLAIAVAAGLSRRMRQLDQQVLRISALSIEQRVALALLDLVQQTGGGDGEDRPCVRMTHQNLANVVGVCRQTITETLGKFRREGILETQHGGVRILDLQKLSEKASAGG